MAGWRWKVTFLPERSDIGEQAGAEEEVEGAGREEGGIWEGGGAEGSGEVVECEV